jgi:molecular chaperone GrpE (heat shock protein)
MTEIPIDDELIEDEPGPGPEAADVAETTGAVAEAPVDEPEPDPEPEPHLELLARLEDRLAESQRLLGRQTEIAASLHEENQRLKVGELRRALAPLVRDVLRVQDDVTAMLDTHADADAGAARDLDLVRGALLDALVS